MSIRKIWERKDRETNLIRRVKKAFSNLKANLLGIVDDEKFEVTEDIIRIWCSHVAGIVMGLVAGWLSWRYCHEQYLEFQEMGIDYELGLTTAPPPMLLFILTMIWSGFWVLLVSIALCGVCHLLIGFLFTRNLPRREEIRTLSVSLTVFFYVALVFICIVI